MPQDGGIPIPLYSYQCQAGCIFEKFLKLADFDEPQACPAHHYHGERILSAPLLVKVAQDVCYDSPIDGRPITSWAQRREDLVRHNCEPYDPDRKSDYLRRQQDAAAALDQSIEDTVERAIEKMPTKKRGQLFSELTEQGKNLQYTRSTRVA